MIIDLLILDFDGVLTDDRVYVNQDGDEMVACHRGDGWGIKLLKEQSVEVIILSTESNPVVTARAQKLGIACLQNCSDKAVVVRQLIAEKKLESERVMYIGNDTNDEEAMSIVGYSVAPADAHPKIRTLAKMVTQSKGGYGVVREVADLLLSNPD